MKGTIAFSGTSTRDNRPAAGPPSFLLLYYVHGELAVTFNEQTWPILKNLALKTKITPKIGNFSDEQGLQNNFNRKYLYNSKIIPDKTLWMR